MQQGRTSSMHAWRLPALACRAGLRIRRKRFRSGGTAVAVTAIMLMLLSCAPPASPRAGSQVVDGAPVAPAAPKTLRIAMQSQNEPTASTAGPASPAAYGGAGQGSSALEHYFIFHGNLTAFDSQRNTVARFAEKIPSLDNGDWRILPSGGMEVTWKLRPDVVWHDGAPLTADDYVFGFQVVRDPELQVEARADLPSIADVEALDAHTLLVRWKTQSNHGNINGNDGLPAIPRHVFGSLYAAGDKAAFENSPLWNTGWVGLGPYRMGRWERGTFMEALAFDKYALGKPKIDRLVIRYIGDVNTLVANVLAAEIDLVPAGAQLDIGQMVAIRQAWDSSGAGFTLLNTKSVRTLYLQLRDPAAPWVQDLRVRQALLHGLNRDEIVESLLSGLVPRADFYIAPDDPIHRLAVQRGVPTYPYDLARTERLLADAGWTRGPDRVFRNAAGQPLTIDVTASGQGDNVTEAVTVAGQWSASGFQSNPTPYPAAAENAAEIRHTNKAALIWPWNFSVNDPRTLTTTEIGATATRWRGGNYGGFSSRAYDGLYGQLGTELDPSKQQEAHFQIVKIIAEELPVLPLFYRATGLAARKGVEGPTSTPPVQAGSAWNIHTWNVTN